MQLRHQVTAGEESVTIWIELEGGETQVTLSLGATVQNALDEADIQFDNLR
jgi:hypothetical protein